MLKKILVLLMALYAAIAFAAVDVNTADATQLDSVKGIGPATAAKIVEERKKGQFKDWDDFVNRVSGVGEKSAVKLSEGGLTVNGATFKGMAAKPAAAATPAPASKPAAPAAATTPAPATKPAAAATAAPAAMPAPAAKPMADTKAPAAVMSADDKKAAAKKAKEEKAAAAKREKEDKAAAKKKAKEEKAAKAADAKASAPAAKK